MNLINTLRMYAEDMHSATGYSERSSAMSKAADMIEKFENMSACEACATIPSVMEYVQQLEQECDELKEKVARLSALLEAEPFRNERIEQLEAEVSCEEKRFSMAHEMIAELAAQNEALKQAITETGVALAVVTKVYWDKFCPETHAQVDASFKLMNSSLNLPNLAESILKRRDATVESKLLRGLASGANGGKDGRITCKDQLDMVAEIEKETT